MAAQGILSVVGKDKNVKFKVVSGCNGFNVRELKKKLEDTMKSDTLLTLDMVNSAAQDVDLGCDDCLIVMGIYGEIFPINLDKLPESYRKTFNKPTFNPRWEPGTADYVAMIKEK